MYPHIVALKYDQQNGTCGYVTKIQYFNLIAYAGVKIGVSKCLLPAYGAGTTRSSDWREDSMSCDHAANPVLWPVTRIPCK